MNWRKILNYLNLLHSFLFPQIKCYHKNTLSSGRDIIFRCQFHTGAIVDHGLVLNKTELDDACKGGLFSVVYLKGQRKGEKLGTGKE